jgi:hypothetical protein
VATARRPAALRCRRGGMLCSRRRRRRPGQNRRAPRACRDRSRRGCDR